MLLFLRRLSILAFFIVCSTSLMAQVNSAGSGDWGTGATWVGGSVPASTASAVIKAGHTVEINANHTIANITVEAGATLRVKGGTGGRTLTVASQNTSTGNFANSGTVDFSEGNDTVVVVLNSTHNNTKTWGGSGSTQFHSLRLDCSTNSYNQLNVTFGQFSGVTLSGRINFTGNINIVNLLDVQRGLLVLGTQTDATQTHNIGAIRIGSANSTNTPSSCTLGSGNIRCNTQILGNNAVRCSLYVNVERDIVTSASIGTGASGVGFALSGPDARGGTIAGQDAAAPHTNKTRFVVGGSVNFNKNMSMGGNVVYSSAGTTQPLDSLILDIGKDFVYTAVPQLTFCSTTFRLSYAGYAGGYGHSGISYPVFKLRGGTSGTPAVLNIDPQFFTTVNNHSGDATCHWRIEQGAYVQLAATGAICVREGRRLTINGTLDVANGGQIVARQVGTCSNTTCPEPAFVFGTLGRLIVRDPDGLGDGLTEMNTASRGVFTKSGTYANFDDITGLSSNGTVEFRCTSTPVIRARQYAKLHINSPGIICSLSTGTTTIMAQGELRVSNKSTLRLTATSAPTLTIQATNTTLHLEPGSRLETFGTSITGFARFGNGTTSGARGSAAAVCQGTIVYNSTTADETWPAVEFDTVIVNKGTFNLTLATDTCSATSSLQALSGQVNINVVSSTLQLKGGYNNLGGSPAGTISGGTNSHLLMGGGSAAPAGDVPSVTGGLGRLTVDRSAGVTLSYAMILNTGLGLMSGQLTHDLNLTLATNASILRQTGTMDRAPIFNSNHTLTYWGPTPVTTGAEVPVSSSVISNVNFANGADVTLNSDLTYSGALVVNSGCVFRLGSNGLAASGTATSVMTTSGTGLIETTSGSELRFLGSTTTAQTLPTLSGVLRNLAFFRPITLNANQDLVIENQVVSVGSRAIALNGRSLTLKGDITGPLSFTGTAASRLVLAGSGTITGTIAWPTTLLNFRQERSGSAVTLGANLTTDSLFVAAGNTFNMSGRVVTVSRSCVINGTPTGNATSNLTITDAGNNQPTWNWPSTLTSWPGIITLNRASGANVASPVSTTFLSLRQGLVTHSGNLTILSGGTLTKVAGDFDQTPIYVGSINLTYGIGAPGNRVITGREVPSSGSISSLTINSDTGAVVLSSNLTMTGVLTFTTGRLRLGDYNLIKQNNTAFTGVTTARYVEADRRGALIMSTSGAFGSMASPLLLPIGSDLIRGSYSPVRVGNATTLTVSARVRDSICYRNAPDCASPVNNVVKKTWQVDILNGTPNATFDIGWTAAAEQGTFDRAGAVAIYRYNQATMRWDQSNATSVTVIPNTIATYRLTGKTQFSPHGIGNQGGPLPVTLTRFAGYREGTDVKLEWTTATETQNEGWYIERSTDGKAFESLGFVKGAGNSLGTAHYQFVDETFSGLAHYRLRQVDTDGGYSYSPTVIIRSEMLKGRSYTLYPNPDKGNARLSVSGKGAADEWVRLSVLDATGKILAETQGSAEEVARLVETLSPRLKPGIYILRLREGGESLNLKWVRE